MCTKHQTALGQSGTGINYCFHWMTTAHTKVMTHNVESDVNAPTGEKLSVEVVMVEMKQCRSGNFLAHKR